ncbi:MAG: non-lysosomal glucosylceramidase [Anaerolineae bacterium]|nr:non-lysosomal glucosylceramidase [Anaerolineae bacterium]
MPKMFDETASAVAFPLGGVGTGTVSLGARGDLRDWEIFNRPAKGTRLPNTYFALRLRPADGPPVARILEAALQPPYNLSHGFDPQTAAGLPRFPHSRFTGEYPLARIDFVDDALPVQVHLEAFNPLVPLDPEESGLPAAFFTCHITNTGPVPLEVTLVGSLFNPVGSPEFDPTGKQRTEQRGRTVNLVQHAGEVSGVLLTNPEIATDALEFGTLTLATDFPRTTIKPAWLRSGWWDFLRDFWHDLLDDGRLTDFGYTTPGTYPDTASVGAFTTLAPQETAVIRFVIAWHFPNRINSWDQHAGPRTRNHYARRFADAWDVATYALRERPRLEAITRQFHAALFDSTLPAAVIEALSANIVPVRSNTCFWLEDGRFMAWEGCFDAAGCCHGTCTHVWSYVYTVALLFPSLEREMRRIELNVETDPDGYMPFRSLRTFDPTAIWLINGGQHAAVDGQMGTILRVYREWLLSGDTAWLRHLWENVKRALHYATLQWDAAGDGLLDGRQHNTYDIDFYGPNPLSSIYYLAALRATAALARVLDDVDLATRCEERARLGGQRVAARLWQGDYYIQDCADLNAHPYQHGTGCLADQLLGQLHAHLLGLGDLLPPEQIRLALNAIYRHNFRQDFTTHVNTQRTFVLGDEAGLILCTWPHGGEPAFPFPYSDEVWTGVEYQVAAHLIAVGSVAEGLNLVAAVRARHDGHRRNPWNEVECGHHYARSMSSGALLWALTGMQIDPLRRELRFSPVRVGGANYVSFWSSGQAWGRLYSQDGRHRLEVLGGSLDGWQVWVDARPLD